MPLKEELIALGYNDNQIESILSKKKLYFQEDVDNIIEKSKITIEGKIKDKFVSKDDYDLLNSSYNNLNKDMKTKSIKEVFTKVGGKGDKEFDSFLKLNEDLLDFEGNDLEKKLIDKATDFDWAFENTKNANVQDNQVLKDLKDDNETLELVQGTIYKNNIY